MNPGEESRCSCYNRGYSCTVPGCPGANEPEAQNVPGPESYLELVNQVLKRPATYFLYIPLIMPEKSLLQRIF